MRLTLDSLNSIWRSLQGEQVIDATIVGIPCFACVIGLDESNCWNCHMILAVGSEAIDLECRYFQNPLNCVLD